MKITGITLDRFKEITESISLSFYEGNIVVHQDGQDASNSKGGRCVARLTATDSDGPGTRTTWSGRRGKYACWHAYRDVLIAVFDVNPDAKVVTGMATYEGRDGFYRDYPATANQNIGSEFQPAYMADLCKCGH